MTKPKRSPRILFSTATAIAFSLTFVGGSVALLFGLLPARALVMAGGIDTAVVLLFVPLCALLFAIVAEVLRSSLKGKGHPAPARAVGRLTDWRPGHGEG